MFDFSPFLLCKFCAYHLHHFSSHDGTNLSALAEVVAIDETVKETS